MQAFKTQQVIRIAFLLFGMYALLAARIFHVQFLPEAATLRKQESKENRSRWRYAKEFYERGTRGAIHDRNGRMLAGGYDRFDLLCDPWAKYSPPPSQTDRYALYERLELLCELLDDLGIEHDRDEILVKGTDEYSWGMRKGERVQIKNHGLKLASGILDFQRAYILRVMYSRGIQQFSFAPTSVREYPQGELTSDIVGHLGWIGKEGEVAVRGGAAGLEYSLNSILGSRDGAYVCEKDGSGVEFDVDGYWKSRPEDGWDIHTSIDLRVQSIADRALRQAVDSFDCHSGCAIVLDSATGDILAVCGVMKDPESKRPGCIAFTQAYEPGSTIKPLIMAKALEGGYVTWADRFDTNGGRYVFREGRASRPLKDSSQHQVLNLAEVLIYSSNIGMAMISHDRMGYDNLLRCLGELEFDRPLDLPYPAMARPLMPGKRESKLNISVSVAFGHGISMSPLALTAKLNIFANGGVYHEPRLVLEAKRGDEVVITQPRERSMVPADIADQILNTMENVVKDGTGKVLKDMKWRVAAKTGTAQALPYGSGKYHSSMVAIAPVSKPRLTVYVALFNVDGKTIYGGTVAGPVIKDILAQALPIYGAAPDRE